MKEVDYQNERVDAINETTAMAHETTLLNPRFYTTNFKEMDELNVESVRKDWDELIENFKKLIKEKTGKKPFTNINLVRI